MSRDLVAFYVKLATDSDALSEFVRAPRDSAERAGLSQADCDVLLSGDQGRIHAALRPAAAAAAAAATPSPPSEPAGGWPTYYVAYQLTPYGWVASLCGAPSGLAPRAEGDADTPEKDRSTPEHENAQGGATSAGATP